MNLVFDIAITCLGFTFFAFLHTLLARQKIKRMLFDRLPFLRPYYRILYTILAIVTFGIWYLYSPFPEGILYRVSSPFSILFRILQAVGVIGFFLSLKPINLSEFIGIQQVALYHKSNQMSFTEPSAELVTEGLYRWVRHPLYTTSIMILLFNPVMSLKLGLITILVILYCWIGSVYEERNLIELYGEEYIEYRQNVPRFIPKIPLF